MQCRHLCCCRGLGRLQPLRSPSTASTTILQHDRRAGPADPAADGCRRPCGRSVPVNRFAFHPTACAAEPSDSIDCETSFPRSRQRQLTARFSPLRSRLRYRDAMSRCGLKSTLIRCSGRQMRSVMDGIQIVARDHFCDVGDVATMAERIGGTQVGSCEAGRVCLCQ